MQLPHVQYAVVKYVALRYITVRFSSVQFSAVYSTSVRHTVHSNMVYNHTRNKRTLSLLSPLNTMTHSRSYSFLSSLLFSSSLTTHYRSSPLITPIHTLSLLPFLLLSSPPLSHLLGERAFQLWPDHCWMRGRGSAPGDVISRNLG